MFKLSIIFLSTFLVIADESRQLGTVSKLNFNFYNHFKTDLTPHVKAVSILANGGFLIGKRNKRRRVNGKGFEEALLAGPMQTVQEVIVCLNNVHF